MMVQKVTDSKLLKTVAECGMNQTEAARRLGMRQQSVNDRLRNPRLKKTFAELLEKDKRTNNKALKNIIAEGLASTKSIVAGDDVIDAPDMPTRHKYLVTALEAKKELHQHQGTGVQVSVVNINYGHRTRSNDSALRDEGERA